MKKILIAGAGHGGLTAAYNLAKNGYNVTVLEKKREDEMGHDWHDCLELGAFDEAGLSRPDESLYHNNVNQMFTSPSLDHELIVPMGEKEGISMDRKDLIKYLIEKAREAGVNFVFEVNILKAVTEKNKVTGLKYETKTQTFSEKCDLVIDAAGLYSPVRSNLPDICGIEKHFSDIDVFHVYRAYFDNTTGETEEIPYIVDLFHTNKPGIDWIITEKDYVDILIGKFGACGELTEQEIADGIEDYKKRFPYVGSKLLRGGQQADIPLRKMLPLIVCDGYAAIGDSAGMTIPLNGSGIVLSMKAGKILADTVIAAGNGELTKAALWSYEYNYFQKLGKDLILINILKNFFTCIEGKHVDYFVKNGILTEDKLAFSGGIEITPDYVFNIIKVLPPVINLVPDLLKYFKGMPAMDLVAKAMPKKFNEKAVNAWIKTYKAL
ncbi:MAG: NAD(P)/FAD-dependent oxidoreductase [Clostridia bacterium]|nr:NAD(P)/FAD-dependent oxidoreductase [Clostridia bacterium]